MPDPDPVPDPEAPAAPAAPEGADSEAAAAGPAAAGPALARAMLDAALARGRNRHRRLPRPAPSPPEYSGAGPDSRDPLPIGSVLGRLMAARGWQRPAAEATVFGRWTELVGPEVAQHCRPTKLERGELTLEAESTAWATQLRLLAGSLLAQITAVTGPEIVTRLRIHGPASPSWRRGPRRVRGRGPRDTYG